MPLILETIVTTLSPTGALHLVPFGLIQEGDDYVLAPFGPRRPSRTWRRARISRRRAPATSG